MALPQHEMGHLERRKSGDFDKKRFNRKDAVATGSRANAKEERKEGLFEETCWFFGNYGLPGNG